MVELVQATPEELDAFSRKCTTKAQLAATTVSKAITAVESVRARWGGAFADAFGQQWAQWQKDMKEFPTEVNDTAAEMTRLASIYRDADQKAKAATAAVGGGAVATGAASVGAAAGAAGSAESRFGADQSGTVRRLLSAGLKLAGVKLVLGASVSAALDYHASGDYTIEGAVASVAHSGLLVAIGATGVGLKVLALNAGVQLGGTGLIMAKSSLGQCIASPEYDRLLAENEEDLHKALSKTDITNVTKSVVKNVVDGVSPRREADLWETVEKGEDVVIGLGQVDSGLGAQNDIIMRALANRIGPPAEWVYSALADSSGGASVRP